MNVQTYVGSSMKGLFTAVAGAVLLFGVMPQASAAPACDELSISEARALPIGSEVTVEGTVSTPSGVFASSFFDAGFGLQDRHAGIYVSVAVDPELIPGDRVRVTGVLAENYGLLVVLPQAAEDVEQLGQGHPPVARRVRTDAVGEATEGLLVWVKARVTQAPISDLPYGYKFTVDDGSGELQIFVNLETGIDVTQIAVGQKLRVTGMSSQFDDHYEIDPRSPEDVVLLPPHGGDCTCSPKPVVTRLAGRDRRRRPFQLHAAASPR